MLTSFAVVLMVLCIGWLAYERARPSSRTVAVVATLAALAALGRDAFAALPDVKPITALTFVVGYALGPLPGFTVGAIGMLASNVVLGEGSYTPWQMAAWGLVGLVGAGVGRVSGRQLGRLGLALACAACAGVAKEIMNVYEWTLGASHSLAALMLTAGKGVPFDVTDVVSTFVFAFAFGPELARLLGRMRARMTVSWEPAQPLAALALLFACGLALGAVRAPAGAAAASSTARAHPAGAAASSTARAQPPGVAASAIARAHLAGAAAGRFAQQVAFLQTAQNPDGGFGGAPGQRSSALYSGWAALGLAAAGEPPAQLARNGHTLLAAIRDQSAAVQTVGDVERTILALHVCATPPVLGDGQDLVARLLHARAQDGSFEDLVNITAFAVFSLRAAGRSADDPLVQGAAGWLVAHQSAGGGFGYAGRGSATDVDDTAAALQAIVAAGGGPAVERAASYLLKAVNRDGGFPQQPGGESNAQSTAWAVQALVAAGQDPGRAPHGAIRSPLAYLRSLVAADGSVRYSRSVAQTPVWVTAQALTALARRPFPISPPVGSGRWPLVRQSSTGSASSASSAVAVGNPAGTVPGTAASSGPGAHVVSGAAGTRMSFGAIGSRAPTGAVGFASATRRAASMSPQDAHIRLDTLAHAAGALLGATLGSLLSP